MNTRPIFLYLLPLFFFLFNVTSVGIHHNTHWLLLPLSCMFLLSALMHVVLSKIRNQPFFWMMVFIFYYSSYLFFGNLKDTFQLLKLPSAYPVLLSFLIIFPILMAWVLTKYSTPKIVFAYLNWLLIILCVLQLKAAIPNITQTFSSSSTNILWKNKPLQHKPSIYFLLFDEYPGSMSIKQYAKKKNSLDSLLQQRGFFVYDTMYSNYDKTVYSINSILNMEYLDAGYYAPYNTYSSYVKNTRAIQENKVTHFFAEKGYQLKNYSLFDIANERTSFSFPLLQTNNKVLYRNTLIARIERDLLWKLCLGKYRTNYFYNKVVLQTHHQNHTILQKTIQASKEATQTPIFLYAHLLMPHEPYFTDSNGYVYDMEKEKHSSDTSQKAWQYLHYTNKRILEVSDGIRQNDSNAIIIICSDHGWRDTPIENKLFYVNNYLALHLPNSKHKPPITSMVNLFRVLLNEYFEQELPLLPSRSFLLEEEKNKMMEIFPH
jgi:hypothetical protein